MITSFRHRLSWRPLLEAASGRGATRAAMARSSFYLFASGALLALTSLAIPGDGSREDVAILATALAALALSFVPFFLFDQLPFWAFHLLTGFGTALVSSGVYFGGQSAVAYAFFYFWVALYAAYFFSWAWVAIHLVFLAFAQSLVTVLRGAESLGSPVWLMTIGTVSGGGLMIWLLRSRQERLLESLERSQEELSESERSLRAKETEAREASERLRALIDASPLAIFELDQDGEVLFWSRAAEQLFGWRRAETVGRPLPVEIQSAIGDWEQLASLIATDAAFTDLEATCRRRNQSSLQVSISTAPLRHGRHQDPRSITLVADVSERKRLESQLLQAQKMETVGRLAGGIAHDFNNVLVVIRSYAWLLRDRLGPEAGREVDELERAAGRAAALVRQLLSFSRRGVRQVQVFDLNVLLTEMETMLRPLIGEDVELVWALDRGGAVIQADPGQVEQIVVNLVVNSRDAMLRGGVIEIETRSGSAPETEGNERRLGGRVELSISDTGVGITSDLKDRIFEPFFTTKGEDRGTGLGLSIVSELVTQAGGEIVVESEEGRGTRFTISFPQVEKLGLRPRQQGPLPEIVRGSETVLVVEDQEPVRELVGNVLERCGYSVLKARNGAEALSIGESHNGSIDLLLTDVVMPKMSGPDLGGHLAQQRRDLKILYMSGYLGEAQMHDEEVIADAPLLKKPFTPDVLAHAVRDVLEDVHGAQPTVSNGSSHPPADRIPRQRESERSK